MHASHFTFIGCNCLAVVVAFALAYLLLSSRPRTEVALASLAGYPLVIIVTLLLLGATGHLTAIGALMVLAVVGIAALLCLIFRRQANTSIVSPAPLRADLSQEMLLTQLAIPISLLAAFAGVVVIKACWSGTQFFSDDHGYHGPTVARWVQEGRFSYVARNFTAYYPFNGELFSLWYVLPFHSGAWAGLAGVFWLVLIGSAAAAIGKELGLSAGPAALVAVLTICSPSILWLVRTFSPPDLAVAALILPGIYFAARAIRRPAGSGISETLYAGLLIGAAVGCKVTAAPVFFVIALALLFNKSRFRLVVVFCLAAALTGSYWYLRNWLATGNPLFPAAIGPFAGPWTSEQQSIEKLIALVGHSQSWPELLAIIKKDFDWPASLAVLSIVGYLAAALQEFTWGRNSSYENLALRRILLASGLALLAVYPFVPFSGNDNSWRYLSAPFLVGLVLYGPLVDERFPTHWLWRAMALVAIVTCWPGPGKNIWVAFVGGSLGLIALYIAVYRLRLLSSASLIVGSLAGVVVLFLGLAMLTNHQQKATDNNLDQYGFPDQPIGRAWNALDAAPAGSRIACFMNRSYDFLPLFGRRYQLDAVAVDAQGKPTPTLHERFASDPALKMRQSKSPAPHNPAELLGNLREAKIDYVLVSKWPALEWPAQHGLLEKSGEVRLFFQDDYSVIWKIKEGRQYEE